MTLHTCHCEDVIKPCLVLALTHGGILCLVALYKKPHYLQGITLHVSRGRQDVLNDIGVTCVDHT